MEKKFNQQNLIEEAKAIYEKGIKDSRKTPAVGGCLGRAKKALKVIFRHGGEGCNEYLFGLLLNKSYRYSHIDILDHFASKEDLFTEDKEPADIATGD